MRERKKKKRGGRSNILKKASHEGRRWHTNQLHQRGLDLSKIPADWENKLTTATKSD